MTIDIKEHFCADCISVDQLIQHFEAAGFTTKKDSRYHMIRYSDDTPEVEVWACTLAISW